MRCLNSFLSHSFGSAEISLTRNITPVFLLLFVLKGGIVSRPISPPTIGIKCVFALVGRVWSWQRSFTAAGAIYYHWSSQRNFVKLSLLTCYLCFLLDESAYYYLCRAFTLYILIYMDTMPIQRLKTVNPLAMVDCQLCGQALNNENVLECAFYQNIVNTYFHDISLRAVAAIYHRTAAALTHPPALPPLAIKQSFLPAARNTNKPVIQITLFTPTLE